MRPLVLPPPWPWFQDGASSFAPFAKEVYEGGRAPERAGSIRAKYAQNTPALSLLDLQLNFKRAFPF